MASARYARLMLCLLGWLQASRWRAALDQAALGSLAEPLKRRAQQLLARRQQKLMNSGRRLERATPQERHRVRIAAKQLRYATEFLRPLCAARRVKRDHDDLAALQDALGALNDAAVADRLLREIEARRPELAPGAAFVRGYLRAAAGPDLSRLAKLCKSLT